MAYSNEIQELLNRKNQLERSIRASDDHMQYISRQRTQGAAASFNAFVDAVRNLYEYDPEQDAELSERRQNFEQACRELAQVEAEIEALKAATPAAERVIKL